MKDTVAWFGARGRTLQTLISMAVSSAFLLFGYDRMLLNLIKLICRGYSSGIDFRQCF
jgi:hypothetical protein